MRLHPHGVDDRVGATPGGHIADDVRQLVVVLREIDGLQSAGLSPGEPLGHAVHGDYLVAQMRRDAGRHVSDRTQPEHCHGATVWNVGVGHRLPRCRQHVGQVHEPRVRRPFWNLDVRELGLRDAKQLRLSAGYLAIKLGVAEQCGAHSLIADLRGLALGEQLLITHVATAARNLEGNHHSVADGEIGYLRTDLADDSHRLVAQNVAGIHECAEHLIQVQIGPADVGGRYLDDGVGRVFDFRVRNRLYSDISLAVPGDCPHSVTPYCLWYRRTRYVTPSVEPAITTLGRSDDRRCSRGYPVEASGNNAERSHRESW